MYARGICKDFQEIFGRFEINHYICSVDLFINFKCIRMKKENCVSQKCRFVLFLHKKSIFLFQDFANNRNFAIFAPNMAYEVQ